VRAAPAVSCANCSNESAHEHTGSAEAIRPSLRSGFTTYFVLSPVTGFLATVTSQDLSHETWRQHRGAKTTRLRRPQQVTLVSRGHRVHRIPPRVRDVRNAPLAGWDGRRDELICVRKKRNIFASQTGPACGVICLSGSAGFGGYCGRPAPGIFEHAVEGSSRLSFTRARTDYGRCSWWA